MASRNSPVPVLAFSHLCMLFTLTHPSLDPPEPIQEYVRLGGSENTKVEIKTQLITALFIFTSLLN
jgi:hypothetical protein